MTTTAATRAEEYTSAAPVLHLAFELGNAKWKLGFTTGLGQRPRERTSSGARGSIHDLKLPVGAAARRSFPGR